MCIDFLVRLIFCVLQQFIGLNLVISNSMGKAHQELSRFLRHFHCFFTSGRVDQLTSPVIQELLRIMLGVSCWTQSTESSHSDEALTRVHDHHNAGLQDSHRHILEQPSAASLHLLSSRAEH